MKDIAVKKNKRYLYRDNNQKADVIDVDTARNTVSGILNTFFYVDSELDMLIPGSTTRSISRSGPNSAAKAKIQHLKDHKMLTDFIAGKFLTLEETTVNDREVLRFDSKIVDRSTLSLYQEEIINQHSIGFRYVDLNLAEKDSENEIARELWDEFFPQAINPEVPEATGFFWVVKEIQLFEGSSVVFGANDQTETLEVRNKDPKTIELTLLTQLELLRKNFRNGQFSKEHFRMIDLQIKQIEQNIIDLKKPSLKDTLKASSVEDTGKVNGVEQFYSLLNF